MQKKHISVVFVVDDELAISKTLALILDWHGYRACSFTDPLDALKQIDANPPDLSISDVVMPQLSGVELAIQVKARVADCRILLISGQASTEDLMKTAKKSGHTFTLLSKPVHPTKILQEIERLESADVR